MQSNFYLPNEPCYQNLIQSMWQVEGFPVFQQENIMPKGVVEVIFNFSDGPPIAASLGGKPYELPKCFINGFNTAPVRLQLPCRQVFFGLVFQPLAVKKIFKTPAGEFSDHTVDIDLLHPGFQSLWHQLADLEDFDQRVSAVKDWLKSNFVEWQPQEQLMNSFLYASRSADISVTKLAGILCYSPRHLSRKLLEATGLNTEELLVYKKYLRAVDLIHYSQLSLTEIAHQCHFADQSHFIKTFKGYTGITPGAYKRNRSGVKGHLYENVR